MPADPAATMVCPPDRDRTSGPDPTGARAIAACRVVIPGEPTAVREGLVRLLAWPGLAGLTAEDRGTAELLLAEALNNVVEHAYARWGGEIGIDLDPRPEHIAVRITDQGLPMPGAAPPPGRLPEIAATEDLPEGGFGWFLIRTLSRNLSYRRLGQVNELTFHIPVGNWLV